MEEQILKATWGLYKSHIVTAVIFTVLIVLVILVTIGAIKFNLVKSLKRKIALSALVMVCAVLLIVFQIKDIVPVYKDCKGSSYVIVQNATVTIKGDSSGVLDYTSTVFVKTAKEEYKLKMQTDILLDTDTEYVGTVAFLPNSKYLIWYAFE